MSADTPSVDTTDPSISVETNAQGQAIGSVRRRGVTVVMFADERANPRDVEATGRTALSILAAELEFGEVDE